MITQEARRLARLDLESVETLIEVSHRKDSVPAIKHRARVVPPDGKPNIYSDWHVPAGLSREARARCRSLALADGQALAARVVRENSDVHGWVVGDIGQPV